MMPAIGLLAILIFVISAKGQTQPTIQTSSLIPIVGQERNLTCFINSPESTSTFPLRWYKDNATLTAHQEETIPFGQVGVTEYTSLYNFSVKAADNQKVISCVAIFPSGTTEAAYTINVCKGPDTSVITGPNVTVSGRISSWTCVVDGASSTAPNIFWEFDNGTRLSSSLYQNSGTIYIDSNNLEIHKVTSILTFKVTSGAPSFAFLCQAFHFTTDSSMSASMNVTVYSPPKVNGGGSTYVVTSGNNVTLDCTMVSDPPLVSVTWYKDGVRVSMSQGRYSGGLPQSPSLTISGVTKTDMGYYLCSGGNDEASSNGTASYLNVTYSKEQYLTKDKSISVETIPLAAALSVVAAGGIAAVLIYWYRRRSSSKKDKSCLHSTTTSTDVGDFQCEFDDKIETTLNVSITANSSSPCNSNTGGKNYRNFNMDFLSPQLENTVVKQTDKVYASTNPYSEANHLYETLPHRNTILNQTDRVYATTNPYSDVTHLYETLPLDALSSATKGPKGNRSETGLRPPDDTYDRSSEFHRNHPAVVAESFCT